MANKYLILLVEDESNIASFITTVLRANQYEVKRAATGEEALMMASSYCPDLIILDLGLPDIDGQKVLSTVRSWTQTPVIVVSARSHERDKVESLDLGADDYITKPFVPFPVSWTVKMKKKQKETQDILSYHTQAAGCSDKARAKASGGRQPIEECGRTGL